SKGQGQITVIIDHSLGGLDGYFLIDEIAKLTRVCIYDRAGYGWSDSSPKQRCSEEIVQELNTLLTKAEIEPPYMSS
ncbi:MAG: alpha/beta hydrolase, partial [Hydrococcus sp. RM1_1_31]|nr:alpha/beta hydrolase [Hydrococcus sp. RM1_1_31]